MLQLHPGLSPWFDLELSTMAFSLSKTLWPSILASHPGQPDRHLFAPIKHAVFPCSQSHQTIHTVSMQYGQTDILLVTSFQRPAA